MCDKTELKKNEEESVQINLSIYVFKNLNKISD